MHPPYLALTHPRWPWPPLRSRTAPECALPPPPPFARAQTKESTLLSYFGEVKAVLRQRWLERPTSWGDAERAMHESLMRHQAAVHAALCDNFNTGAAMGELLTIASEAFHYLRDSPSPDALLLRKGAAYVTKMLRTFGVITSHDDVGFPLASSSGGADNYEAQVRCALDGRPTPMESPQGEPPKESPEQSPEQSPKESPKESPRGEPQRRAPR